MKRLQKFFNIITGFTTAEYENISNLGFLHDIFVSKLDSNGKTIWNELIGTEDNDKAYSVEVGEDNSIYIGGFTAGDLEGVAHNGAALVTKLNPNGSQNWMKVYGSTMSPDLKGMDSVNSMGFHDHRWIPAGFHGFHRFLLMSINSMSFNDCRRLLWLHGFHGFYGNRTIWPMWPCTGGAPAQPI